MDCQQVREILSSFNDREAGPEEIRAVEEHLRSCKDCAFESTMIVGLKRLLGEWKGVRASQEFRAKLIERVKREPKPKRSLRGLWWTLGLAGAVSVVVLLMVVLWPSGGPAEGVAPTRPVERSGPAAPDAEEPGAGTGPFAQVLVQQGTLRIRRSDGAESLGSAGDVLELGDSVKVSKRGEVELALVGGLKIRLESGAEFALGEGPSEGELDSGTALLLGETGVREGEVYSVKTGPALISLEKRGLLAKLELAEDGSLTVSVAAGRSEVMLPSGVQTLEAGQALAVSADGEIVSPVDAAERSVLERLRRWGKR